jgi:hypothetical protein
MSDKVETHKLGVSTSHNKTLRHCVSAFSFLKLTIAFIDTHQVLIAVFTRKRHITSRESQ